MFVCSHSWRRCADESLINLNQRLRRTAPLLENISRYVLYFWSVNVTVQIILLKCLFPCKYIFEKWNCDSFLKTWLIDFFFFFTLYKCLFFSLCYYRAEHQCGILHFYETYSLDRSSSGVFFWNSQNMPQVFAYHISLRQYSVSV